MERDLRLDDSVGAVIDVLMDKPFILTREQTRELVSIVSAATGRSVDVEAIVDEYAATHPVRWVRRRE